MATHVFQPGWIPFDERTPEGNLAHEKAVASLSDFRIIGSVKAPATKKVVLTDIWRHPQVRAALGYEFSRFHQLTGSCVGAGGGNAQFTLMAIEVVRLGDREQLVLPFWPYTYGKSRLRAGLRGRGEGSFGSTFATAALHDGWLPATLSGLPQFRNNDGVELTQQIEYEWSDGAAIPNNYAQIAKPHVLKSAAQVRNADDVRDAIVSGFPCTVAYGGYVDNAYIKGSGDEAILVGDIDANGGHQTSLQGYIEHPRFGEYFLYVNQWPESSYPKDPQGGPPCSVWIPKARVERMCREGEVIVFSQFDGFPAQDIERILFRVIGA